jgi:hypothetical protein
MSWRAIHLRKRELLIFVWPGLLATGYAASTLGGPVAQQGLPGHDLKAPLRSTVRLACSTDMALPAAGISFPGTESAV